MLVETGTFCAVESETQLLSTARGMWGAELRHTMLDYNYYSGLGIVGEVLPQERTW